jgi:hypothetical protein
MFAMPVIRAFALVPEQGCDGVFAGPNGIFIGGIPLLRRVERAQKSHARDGPWRR